MPQIANLIFDMKREQSTFGLVCNISSGHALFSTSRIGVVTNYFWYLRILKKKARPNQFINMERHT
jgi:hypothetical protein